MTGDGDADLYVRKGAAPTAPTYDCRPYNTARAPRAARSSGPATVYVGVNGYAATQQLSAQGRCTPRARAAARRHAAAAGERSRTSTRPATVAQGELKVVPASDPRGKKVVIRTTSPSDVDLYIQFGAAPTTGGVPQPRLHLVGQRDRDVHARRSNGTLYIGVHGYAAGSFTLKTADN